MTALALRDEQSYWDEAQLAVLEQSGISQSVTRAELSTFLHVCQRTGLDPFARQIYLIGRWDKKAGRDVYRPQTGIDGYRIIAQRTCERTGQSLGYDDTVWCGADGQWTDAWLSPDPPAAAKVSVLRGGQRFSAVALWSEYVPMNSKGEITGLWVKRHAAQLEKCAEALALRKAFPNDMAGVYTAEEMAQADNVPPVPAPESQAPVTGQVIPAAANGNGRTERPAQPARPSRDEVDEDAQPFAEEVSQCTTLAALQDVNTRAREARKTSALIRNPATGGTGGLGQYVQWKRRQLEDTEKALRALTEAASAAGVLDDIDEHMQRLTGVGVEAATAAQMRDAAVALAKASVPA